MPTNQLHPVYHSLSYQAGSRIDVNRRLPSDLDDVDMDEFLDQLSEPQKFAERICPVSTVIGSEIVRGKNWQEMMSKSYRVFLRMFTSISYYVRQAMVEKFDERGLVPFMSAVVEPDLLHHTVEQDYEQGENSYATLMEFFRTGLVPRFPTLIVSGVMMTLSILMLVCGLILDTVAKKHRQLFEVNLNLLQILHDRDREP